MTTSSRETVHDLIDKLPEAQLILIQTIVEYRLGREVDPILLRMALAPYDDEPETPEEAAAVAQARSEIARGEGYSHEEIKREFGL